MRSSVRARWLIAALLALVLVMATVPMAQAAPEQSDGYYYTVQRGDSWSSVSRQTGVPVAALQAANPRAVRPPRYWLYAGETLFVPGSSMPPNCGYSYVVRPGDSWSRIAARAGISVRALQAANPAQVRPPHFTLYAGETLFIPCDGGHPPVCSYYTVQRGDSWYAIARRTGVSVHALQAANPAKVRPPKYVLYTGETLCIPDP